MPTAAKMPEYLKAQAYRNPQDNNNSIFAHALGKEFWTYLSTQPEVSANFNNFMQSRRKGRPSWFDPYPVKENLLSGFDLSSPDAVLLVDVGGNKGHDLLSFQEEIPGYTGRLILQDQPKVIADVEDGLMEKGIECMANDFFISQPVSGTLCHAFPLCTASLVSPTQKAS